MECEDCYASCDGEYNEVFVQRVLLAEESDVQEHDGEKLAGLGQDESYVVNVGEGGVSEWGGEGGSKSDEAEGEEDTSARDEGWKRFALRSCRPKVEEACEGSEGGLDGVQDNREFEKFWGLGVTVWSGGEAFLKKRPRKTR